MIASRPASSVIFGSPAGSPNRPATAGHGLPCSQPRSLPLDRRGRLKNGARPGDFLAARRCGARARHGAACLQPAMKNGRCRFHGGKSTGPRTPEGRERCRLAATIHGGYSREIKALRREASCSVARLRAFTAIANGTASADQIAIVRAIVAASAAPAALDATAGHGVPCSQANCSAPSESRATRSG